MTVVCTPRPWLTRQPGECAWPVDGEGWLTRSCCNPCAGATYCAGHRAMRSRPFRTSMRVEIARLAALGLIG